MFNKLVALVDTELEVAGVYNYLLRCDRDEFSGFDSLVDSGKYTNCAAALSTIASTSLEYGYSGCTLPSGQVIPATDRPARTEEAARDDDAPVMFEQDLASPDAAFRAAASIIDEQMQEAQQEGGGDSHPQGDVEMGEAETQTADVAPSVVAEGSQVAPSRLGSEVAHTGGAGGSQALSRGGESRVAHTEGAAVSQVASQGAGGVEVQGGGGSGGGSGGDAH